MERIETRVQLINYIYDHISQNAIARACHTGTVQVLGGFSCVPPGTRPGFIVSITSIHERTWLIAVTTDDHKHIFHVWVVESIPWEYYMCPSRAQQLKGYSIYFGDNPDQARIAWMKTKTLEFLEDETNGNE